MQAPFVAAMSIAKGTSVIEERIFESRAAHAVELIRMGANITLTSDERVFVIKGRPYLQGTTVESKDLRGGAALVLAGLAAKGEVVIGNVGQLDRGYERFEEKFRALGADIRRVTV
jgi:UDP-N-acetylglucosamine 1-carboxyvinyltransferase